MIKYIFTPVGWILGFVVSSLFVVSASLFYVIAIIWDYKLYRNCKVKFELAMFIDVWLNHFDPFIDMFKWAKLEWIQMRQKREKTDS